MIRWWIGIWSSWPGVWRPNTVRAVAFDSKTFFTVIVKSPVDVEPADVFEFLAAQRGDRSVVRMTDRESGVSARTIAWRLSSVSGFYAYALARGDTGVRSNPVPRGLATRQGRRGRGCRWCGCRDAAENPRSRRCRSARRGSAH